MKKTYIAKTPLLLDGVKYPVGSEVELEDSQADRMARVVKLVSETGANAKKTKVDAKAKAESDAKKAEADAKAKAESDAKKAEADAKAKAESDAKKAEADAKAKAESDAKKAEADAKAKAESDAKKAEADAKAKAESDAKKAEADAKAKAESDASDDNTDGTDETGAGGSTEDDSGDGMKSVLEQVVEAIADMKVNDANYTKKGDLSKGAKPDSSVLDNLLDFDVSAALRDEAWAKYQDNN